MYVTIHVYVIERKVKTVRRQYGLRIWDAVLMVGIFITAVLLFLLPILAGSSGKAEIVIVKTGEIRSVSLDTDNEYEIVTEDGELTVCVKDGEVFVSRSSCRDGVCRNTPPVSHSGQSIVCAPAGVMIRITGEEADVDGVSG